jgi:hypothetical protein
MFDTPTQLLLSPAYKKTLDYVVDTTDQFLKDPDKETFLADRGMPVNPEILSQFKPFDDNAPYKEADSFDVLEFLVKQNMSIASIVAKGANLPQTSMGQLIKVEGGMAKIGLRHIFDEQTMETMIKLRQAHNIPEVFVDMLFGNVDSLQRKIHKTGNVLTAQAWYQGRVLFTDPRTNVGLEIKYDTRPELFPEPLTGADTWDNRDTAQGIDNLIEHNLAYYNINGFFPKCTKMSLSLINDLMKQTSTAAIAASMGLINSHPTSSLPSRVNRKVLNQMIEETEELSPIEQWDTQYELEIEPGRSIKLRYLPNHTYCFVQPNAVERLWGLTLESGMGQVGFGNKFANNKMQPKGGIFTKANEDLKLSPPESSCLGVGRMIPFCPDARKLGARKVKAA